MIRPVMFALIAVLVAVVASAPADAQVSPFPKPTTYPTSWELSFQYQTPERIEVDGRAYWYLTYTVTNNTGDEHVFLPVFEMLMEDGIVRRSEKGVPPQVFTAINRREKNQFLQNFAQIGGSLRLGKDEAKDGVAIWPEPNPEMGRFAIFVSGLSGEAVIMKDASGEPMKKANGDPIILRKTLQLNYHVRGDEVYPGEDAINENASGWVMR